jgi:hypothetical protein
VAATNSSTWQSVRPGSFLTATKCNTPAVFTDLRSPTRECFDLQISASSVVHQSWGFFSIF